MNTYRIWQLTNEGRAIHICDRAHYTPDEAFRWRADAAGKGVLALVTGRYLVAKIDGIGAHDEAALFDYVAPTERSIKRAEF